jgi:hypothetical protein
MAVVMERKEERKGSEATVKAEGDTSEELGRSLVTGLERQEAMMTKRYFHCTT